VELEKYYNKQGLRREVRGNKKIPLSVISSLINSGIKQYIVVRVENILVGEIRNLVQWIKYHNRILSDLKNSMNDLLSAAEGGEPLTCWRCLPKYPLFLSNIF